MPGDARLLAQLERSRALGFLGPGPVEDHLLHARALLQVCDAADSPEGTWLDLGSGGGLPGLVCAFDRPDQALVLLDASSRRCEFLAEACAALDRSDVVVLHGRAEDLARASEYARRCALVMARSFAKPSVTAECAAGFLAVPGVLVVSDRAEDSVVRWSPTGLATLGFEPAEQVSLDDATVAIMRHTAKISGFPRRNGVPSKRPLW